VWNWRNSQLFAIVYSVEEAQLHDAPPVQLLPTVPQGGYTMNFGLLACNIGSIFLGMTLAFVLMLFLAGRHNPVDGVDSCLTALLCVFGFGIAIFFYMLAMVLPA
jgi:hypothetical protein